MATYLENLQTARERLAAALAANAGRPNYTIDGESFDFDSLVRRIAMLDEAIGAAQGPFEVVSERT